MKHVVHQYHSNEQHQQLLLEINDNEIWKTDETIVVNNGLIYAWSVVKGEIYNMQQGNVKKKKKNTLTNTNTSRNTKNVLFRIK